MKKILGYVVIISACLAFSIYGRGGLENLSFDAGIATDSTADSTVAPKGRILVSSGSRSIISSIDLKGIVGSIVIGASTLTSVGFGLDDTAVITIGTGFGTAAFVNIDSVHCASLPCTLQVAHTGSTAGADTLFKSLINISWRIYDSSGGKPEIVGGTYPISAQFLWRD